MTTVDFVDFICFFACDFGIFIPTCDWTRTTLWTHSLRSPSLRSRFSQPWIILSWELGAGSWELGGGSWELGGGRRELGAESWELGAGRRELRAGSWEAGAGSWAVGGGAGGRRLEPGAGAEHEEWSWSYAG